MKNHKNRSQPQKDRINTKIRVLILRSGALGDTLMLLPSLAALRNRIEIFVAGRLPGIDFLKPYVSGCFDYEGPGWHQLFSETPEPLHRSPWPSVDLVIAFSADQTNRLQRNLEFYLPNCGIHLFPPFPEQDRHVAFYLGQCLAQAGLPLNPEQAMEAVRHGPLSDPVGSNIKAPGLVFHPGSGSERKNLAPDFWLSLIRSVRCASGLPEALLLLGPAEQALLPYFREKQKEHGAEIVFNPENRDLTKTLKGAALYIGHDSGITHLAAMLGRPCIALFKNSFVAQWRPLGPRVKVIEVAEPLDAVEPQVLQAAESFLNKGSKE